MVWGTFSIADFDWVGTREMKRERKSKSTDTEMQYDAAFQYFFFSFPFFISRVPTKSKSAILLILSEWKNNKLNARLRGGMSEVRRCIVDCALVLFRPQSTILERRSFVLPFDRFCTTTIHEVRQPGIKQFRVQLLVVFSVFSGHRSTFVDLLVPSSIENPNTVMKLESLQNLLNKIIIQNLLNKRSKTNETGTVHPNVAKRTALVAPPQLIRP